MINSNIVTTYHSDDKLKIFDFEGNKVRTFIDKSGEPWFVATDLSNVLGYRMASDATRVLDDEEKGTQIVRTLGGNGIRLNDMLR